MTLTWLRALAVEATAFNFKAVVAHASHCSSLHVARTFQCSQPFDAANANPGNIADGVMQRQTHKALRPGGAGRLILEPGSAQEIVWPEWLDP